MILDELHISKQIEKLPSKNASRFLLTVSGGKDSMVLLDLFRSLDLDFEVAHMNYNLRSEDSNLDEELVREVCSEIQVQLNVKSVDAKEFFKENKLSTQEGARLLRYDWFSELLKQRKLDFIVTAHHQEDNKETFFQNLKRGSGLRGLKSMVVFHSNRFKPMLFCSRESIDEYAVEQNIVYRQDASNNQNHYQRNVIRNKVLPFLSSKMPGFSGGISKSIDLLQDDYDFLQYALEQIKQDVLVKDEKDWVIKKYKSVHPRVLLDVLESFEFNDVQKRDLLRAKQNGKEIIGKHYSGVLQRDCLYIYNREDYLNTELDILIKSEEEFLKLRRFEISLEENNSNNNFGNKTTALLDAEKISYPLTLRYWKNGDRFTPVGLHGSKKVSDFLKDERIPLHRRKTVQVLCNDDSILWIVGIGIGEKYKVEKTTRKILKIVTS